jgi:Fe-S oxidoreductase/nitrate reductase gamma subunit
MSPSSLTREIYGNIDPVSKGIFYALAAVALGTCAHGIYRRMKLWRLGRTNPAPIDWRKTVSRIFGQVLSQRTLRTSRPAASLAHLLLFSGFIVLTIGTMLIAIEHLAASAAGRLPNDPLFHKGTYFAIYELVMDIFGVAMLVGCCWFLVRRAAPAGDGNSDTAASIGRHWTDQLVLAALLLLGLSGYLVEGLRIVWDQTPQPGFSVVAVSLKKKFQAIGVNIPGAESIHFVLWWCHAVMALTLIAVFPHTRLLHAFAGAIQLATVTRQLGQMQPVSIEQVEETGLIGVGTLVDFHRQQLRELDACVSCGRCQDACPAYEAGKPLSPRDLVQDLRAELNRQARQLLAGGGKDIPSLHGEVIDAETLWSCTTCSACVAVCPLGISPLDMITDMRRNLVGEGQLRGSPATALQKVQRSGNPWGLPAESRFDWSEGLDVPTVQENPDFELLYWVGCAAAYDRRTQKVARAVVQLLHAAQVNFAVLGPEERCSGDFARRMGDEFLFQELASGNIATLDTHQLASAERRIVTHCPHCLNSLVNDYPQFGGHYDVLHHSQLLAELVEQGRLKISPAVARDVTFHDPCYLARVHNVTEEPRQLIQLASTKPGLLEMKRQRQQTSCCGAGGGRMWFDDGPDQRVGVSRVNEALDTGAETVAVSCPFCLTMMTDGIAAQDANVEVKDIAELLLEGLDVKSSLVNA